MVALIQPFPHTNAMLQLELNHTSDYKDRIVYKDKSTNCYSKFQVF